MSKNKTKVEALALADDLCGKHSAHTLQQLASTLFQRTLDTKQRIKWMSSEDDMLATFFYLTSKEELCEALSCDMESLYRRARHLGVVSPSFDTITAIDLSAAVDLFSAGIDQREVLSFFGIDSVTVPVRSLTMAEHSGIYASLEDAPNYQMDLFDED
jgi:hypothetical protein